MSYQSDFANAFYERLASWSNFSENQLQYLTALAVAQAKHESANFTSNVFLNNNNCIGYGYYSGSLWQTGAGTGRPGSEGGGAYAKYANVANCAKELADWIHRRKSYFMDCYTPQQYAAAMKAGSYYADSINNYSNGLLSYYTPPDGEFNDEKPPLLDELSSSIKLSGLLWLFIAVIVGFVVYCVKTVLSYVLRLRL